MSLYPLPPEHQNLPQRRFLEELDEWCQRKFGCAADDPTLPPHIRRQIGRRFHDLYRKHLGRPLRRKTTSAEPTQGLMPKRIRSHG